MQTQALPKGAPMVGEADPDLALGQGGEHPVQLGIEGVEQLNLTKLWVGQHPNIEVVIHRAP